MSITRVEFKNRKPHLRYDAEAKRYVGYQIDVRAGNKRHRNTFRTKGEAERFIDELRTKSVYRNAGLRFKSRADITLRDLFDKRLEQISNPKEKIRARRIFDLFVDTFDYPPKVTEVRSVSFQIYINERLTTGVTPQTVDREVTIVSSAIKQATVLFPEELEDFEPPKVIRPKYRKGKKRKRVITDTEKDAIIESVLSQRVPNENDIRTVNRPVTARIFEIAWLLGFRFSEVLGIKKKDFNARAKSLTVQRWKTDTVTNLKFLPDRVVEILRQSAAASPTDFIFDLTCSEPTFTKMIREACKANDITYGRSVKDGVTFHSTRHSFTSRLVQVTDIATAGEFTGHSSSEMVDYYSHATDESKRLAMEKLYGNGRHDSLVDIYEKVSSGNMSLDGFLAALK